MAKKSLVLRGCDAERARLLIIEIGKVRCWITGFNAARHDGHTLQIGVPGEDSLRQIQVLLSDATVTQDKRGNENEV
jgi:hypothetical protein